MNSIISSAPNLHIKNHYKVLEVEENSSKKDIAIAFNLLMKEHEEKDQELLKAYKTLIDEKTRKEYDISQYELGKAVEDSNNKYNDGKNIFIGQVTSALLVLMILFLYRIYRILKDLWK